ncbi:MAG: hypothetical protein OEV88_13080 [Gammaproteobacteria bacterium]|nr:hypothetical protein [Gammaproteobacteria bacterium]
MKNQIGKIASARLLAPLLAAILVTAAGCGANAQKGAVEGAATGAMAGAVGGMFTAWVFGGDVARAGARGAAYGGSSGAVVGAMAGGRVDDAQAAQKQARQDAEIRKFREEIGTDAFNGLVALGECKHEIALANAREAARSGKKDFVMAGVWVEVLTEADRNRTEAASALYPRLLAVDRDVKTEADAQAQTAELLRQLREIRVEYGLPAVCSA